VAQSSAIPQRGSTGGYPAGRECVCQ
jgi:hypothetical protein